MADTIFPAVTARQAPAPAVEPPLWWTLNSDEALLREALPEHRPEYC